MLTYTEQLQSITQLTPQRLGELAAAIDKLGSVDPALEAERQNFVSLILENPNYFGNLEGSAFQPVKPIKFNTSYEELVCVGLQPQLDRLEAVIDIKRPTGYGGASCTAGSYEFVRVLAALPNNRAFHHATLAHSTR